MSQTTLKGPATPVEAMLYTPSRAPGMCCRISAQLRATRHSLVSLMPAAAQSVSTAQALPAAHGPQEPPQSASVSSPFLVPSVQLAATHTLLWHTPEAQSWVIAHACEASASWPSPSMKVAGFTEHAASAAVTQMATSCERVRM